MLNRIIKIRRNVFLAYAELTDIYKDSGLDIHFRKQELIPFNMIKNIKALEKADLLSDIEIRRQELNTRRNNIIKWLK